jgi:concanavalin A-like lectin/glucanase superfamily protein
VALWNSIVLAFLCLCSAAQAQFPAPPFVVRPNQTPMIVAGPSPLYWWKMNDAGPTTVADSADSTPGTAAGSPTFSGGVNGIAFSGVAQYVTTGNVADNLANFSLSCWMNYNDASQILISEALLYKISSSSLSNGWYIQVGESGVGNNNGVACYIQQGGGSTYVGRDSNPSVTLTDGNWHSIIVTYASTSGNSPTVTLYVDGSTSGTVPDNNGVWSGASGFSNTNFVTIASDDGLTRDSYWAGSISDSRIYNIALTSGQVSTIYSAGRQ